MTTFYHLLGVRCGATGEELTRARQRLAREHHPDRGGDGALMAEINVAYDTLLNNEKRYRMQLKSTHLDCPTCKGDGGKWRSKGFRHRDFVTCDTCAGSGLVPKPERRK